MIGKARQSEDRSIREGSDLGGVAKAKERIGYDRSLKDRLCASTEKERGVRSRPHPYDCSYIERQELEVLGR